MKQDALKIAVGLFAGILVALTGAWILARQSKRKSRQEDNKGKERTT